MRKIRKGKSSKTPRKAAKRATKRVTKKKDAPVTAVRMSIRVPASVAGMVSMLERECNAPFSTVLVMAARRGILADRENLKLQIIETMAARNGETVI